MIANLCIQFVTVDLVRANRSSRSARNLTITGRSSGASPSPARRQVVLGRDIANAKAALPSSF
jgi:hypothetical protein